MDSCCETCEHTSLSFNLPKEDGHFKWTEIFNTGVSERQFSVLESTPWEGCHFWIQELGS